MKNSVMTLLVAAMLGSLAQAAGIPAELRAMTAATRASQKIGAPVEVYYQHLKASDSAAPNLKLAVVPQVAVNSLRLDLSPGEGVSFDKSSADFKLQKTAAAGIYNRFLNVSKGGSQPATIRATVWVEIDGSTFFSIFNIPVDTASAIALKKSPTGKPARKQPQQ
jgi:hypothetical protein